ncbi:NHL repeat protein [compost metagenome]
MRIPLAKPRILLFLAFTLTLAGCVPPFAGTGSPSPSDQGTIQANHAARLAGLVRGPATLVANNSAGYRLQAYDEAPARMAVVYLTAPDERFYAGPDGKALHTVTDAEGRYAFEGAPAGVPVVVTVLLAENRRLVGFSIPAQGENQLDVDLASTVAAEFLRDQARLAGRSMADYPALAAELPEILRLTRELITSGKMPVPDLNVNAIPAMRHAYVRAFGADQPALGDAWKRLLGYRPLLLDEVDAGLDAGLNALAVHHAEDGSLYTVGFNNVHLQITRRLPGGGFEDVTRGPRTEWIDYVGGLLAQDGMLHVGVLGGLDGLYGFDLGMPFDPEDLLANAPLWVRSGVTPPNTVLPFHPSGLAAKDGVFYASSTDDREIVRYTLGDDMDWDEDDAQIAPELTVIAGDRHALQTFAGDTPSAGANARFNYPTGLTLHHANGKDYLYVADTLNHRIRRIDLSGAPFTTETVLGRGSTVYGNMIKPPGLIEDGKSPQSKEQGYVNLDHPDGVPHEKASFAYPKAVVFDASGRMFVADQDHRRVRMFDGQKVYTLAGTDPGIPGAIGDSRRAGLGEVASLAFDAEGNLLIADGRSNKLKRLWLKFGL